MTVISVGAFANNLKADDKLRKKTSAKFERFCKRFVERTGHQIEKLALARQKSIEKSWNRYYR